MSPISPRASTGALTHRQIAEMLGVSRQLVGFALRGEGRMSDEMRRQILEVAEANGYDRYSNHEARMMASRRYGKRVRTGILAVFFPPTFRGEPLSSVPYFAHYFDGLEAEGIERGIDMMLCPTRPSGLPRLVQQGQVDGVICIMSDTDVLTQLETLSIPVVYIAPTLKDAQPPHGYYELTGDHRHGGFLATQHLISLGHRRIAYLGVSYLPYAGVEVRYPMIDGYQDALEHSGLQMDPALVNNDLDKVTMEAGYAAMQNWLQAGPPKFTGLVCHNDLIAMGAIRALQEAGYEVPRDISVTGFDDVSTQYAFQPALTSVCFPRRRMGQRAVELLAADEPGENLQEVFPITLVERDSTAPLSSGR